SYQVLPLSHGINPTTSQPVASMRYRSTFTSNLGDESAARSTRDKTTATPSQTPVQPHSFLASNQNTEKKPAGHDTPSLTAANPLSGCLKTRNCFIAPS